jgi:D-alanine-D-alanine ligase
MRVGVLTPPQPGAPRADEVDTFVAAEQVSDALRAFGHQPVPIEFVDAETVTRLVERFALDLAFNLVEDLPAGADKLWQVTAVLDELELPYTGARTAALKALGDKRDMKARLLHAGLPVPALADAGAGDARFIVKSAIEHASLGLDAGSVVAGTAAAEALIAQKQAQHGGDWFAEAYVEGREFNVGLIEMQEGPLVLPIAEIRFDGPGPHVLGYAEKWDVAGAAYAATPRVFASAEPALYETLGGLAVAAWQCFRLNGYARVDFRVPPQGQPVILEVNANPALTADAGLCAAAAQLGMSQADVVARILDAARR